MNRSGVALIAVLWLVALLGGAAASGLMAARDTIAATRFRAATRRARWQADDCLTRVRRGMDRVLAAGERGWWQEPTRLDPPGGCALRFTRPDTTSVQPDVWHVEARVVVDGYTLAPIRETWAFGGRRAAVVARVLP